MAGLASGSWLYLLLKVMKFKGKKRQQVLKFFIDSFSKKYICANPLRWLNLLVFYYLFLYCDKILSIERAALKNWSEYTTDELKLEKLIK